MAISEFGRWANGTLLIWAREQLGLTREQASDYFARRLMNVAERAFATEDLLAWERGAGDPNLEDLELLADIYDCPVGYFFLKAPPQEVTPQLDFRGLALDKLGKLGYETHRGIRRFWRLAQYADRLTRELESPFEAHTVTAATTENVKTVVGRVLEKLGITRERQALWITAEEAFEGWRDAIERHGILVFSLKLVPGDVRGACIAHELGRPAILVNHADVEAATGRTFTLLHEYAHLVVNHPGLVCDFRGQQYSAEIETFANRFAAEAIVPREEFRSLLRRKQLDQYHERWSDALLDELRSPFKASRDVVAILLRDLQLAPPDFYQRKREIWERRRPFGRGRPGRSQTLVRRRMMELGSAFSRLLAEAESSGAISRLEVADLLDTNVKQANTFLALAGAT